MPFNNSYVDPKRDIPMDAREKFASLATQVVKEPVSTHIVRVNRDGKLCFFIVDFSELPHEGDLVILSLDSGMKLSRMKATTPHDMVWGKVTWSLAQA